MVHLLLLLIYVAFISLGLPDGLLGAGWPAMYPQLEVPVSYAGGIFTIISAGTVISSLQCDRLTHKLGTGKVMVLSVAMTAAALLGFSFSRSFWMLCLWAIPYGLGAGSVDASLNNYVALHFESKHMSWLHCMWGVGASVGPYIMGAVLTGGGAWTLGYQIVGVLQVALSAVLLISLPLWKTKQAVSGEEETRTPLSIGQILKIPGAKAVMLVFFCYCALEQTVALWAASYLNLYRGLDAQTAASFGSMFFLGITLGRGICGFIAMKLKDDQMIWLGTGILAAGVAVLFLPGPVWLALTGFALIGLGCAPVYPSVIHSTPLRFGADRSQAIIGVQMASAYVGTCLMPPLFGLIAEYISVSLMPVYLLMLLVLMAGMFYRLTRKATICD